MVGSTHHGGETRKMNGPTSWKVAIPEMAFNP